MDINGRDYVQIELFCALDGRNGVFTARDGSYVLNIKPPSKTKSDHPKMVLKNDIILSN